MDSRNTLQRYLVLEAAKVLEHATADDIYQSIAVLYPAISRGTVYRNLNMLAGKGKLRKVVIPGGADRYDTTLMDHYHICCKICGRVEDSELPFQADLLANIPESRGYRLEEHDIIFRGVCPRCQLEDNSQPEG